jgi:hypothetical protein
MNNQKKSRGKKRGRYMKKSIKPRKMVQKEKKGKKKS